MKSLSGVGLGLSLVFGCLLLALMAEIYYLLWWKKKTIHKTTHNNNQYINENGILQIHIPPTKRAQIFQILTCCKNPTSNPTLVHDPQSSSSSSSSSNKAFSKNHPIETLPRLLFTITEETMEDLAESEDGFVLRNANTTNNIRKQSTNLGDLLQGLETPFLTPIGSPLYYTPPMTPTLGIHNHPNNSNNGNNHQRFGQFFEAERDAAFNRMRASPPPKFKFLRDAEEKMIQRTRLMEQQAQHHLNVVLR